MQVLVTGAAGFLGRRLVDALLAGPPGFPAVSRIVAADLTACPVEDPRVEPRVGTIADPSFVRTIVEPGVDAIWHLAAVLSGQAEAEFDLGMRVNIEGTRGLLEACRRLENPPRFVFASTIAVFGGPLPEVVPDDMVLRPQSSYGTEKAIGELLVLEYSRKGFVDGIACRVPTVAIRPGKPNSALSSFVSGIVREPLAGLPSVCPVPLDTRLWISAPGVVTRNLLHAARVPGGALAERRAVNLPGLTVTPGEMLGALERAGGAAARALVTCEPDDRASRIVCSWPGAFDPERALALGFAADRSIHDVIAEYMAEQGA